MSASWDDRITAFWERADATAPDAAEADMAALVAARPAGDPDALYEHASLLDFLGRESEAVPLYRAAIAAGLQGERLPQATVQLASSVRNLGDPAAAVALLERAAPSAVIGAADRAFLALALHDAGRRTEALQVALHALSPHLPRYSRIIASYADELR